MLALSLFFFWLFLCRSAFPSSDDCICVCSAHREQVVKGRDGSLGAQAEAQEWRCVQAGGLWEIQHPSVYVGSIERHISESSNGSPPPSTPCRQEQGLPNFHLKSLLPRLSHVFPNPGLTTVLGLTPMLPLKTQGPNPKELGACLATMSAYSD